MAALTTWEKKVFVSGVVAGAALGGAIAHVVTKRKLETRYQQFADEEIRGMRAYYLEKEEELIETQRELVNQPKKDLDELIKEAGYKIDTKYTPEEVKAISDVVEEEEDVSEVVAGIHTVFPEDSELPKWDYTEEQKKRDFSRPYIIHKNEFQEGVSAVDPQVEDYNQQTLTYFEEDDVLADERDTVIDPQQRDLLVGEANLQRFGHGSEDPNVVYVRNNKLAMDIEILRSEGSYAKEVHGFLEHSDEWNRRRRQFDDD